MNNLDFYLLHDHNARRRSMYLSVIVGAVAGGIVELLGAPFEHAVIACVAASGIVEIVRAARYVQDDRRVQKNIAALPVRRRLIQTAISSAAIALFSAMRIPRAGAQVVERKLQETSDQPINAESVKETQRVLSQAQAAGILASHATVEKLGTKYVRAGVDNAEAWNAALAFANYKSFANHYATIPVLTLAGPELHTTYHFKVVAPFGSPQQYAAGRVPKEEAAQLRMLNERDLNASNTFGNDLIVMEGGGMSLDNTQAKRVVFRSLHIIYAGGPIELQEVYFVDCIFHVEQAGNGPRLVAAILQPSPATSFTAS